MPGTTTAATVAHELVLTRLINVPRGLQAIASGYGLRFPDDLENLRHQFEVYDALYAWCRLDVAGK